MQQVPVCPKAILDAVETPFGSRKVWLIAFPQPEGGARIMVIVEGMMTAFLDELTTGASFIKAGCDVFTAALLMKRLSSMSKESLSSLQRGRLENEPQGAMQ